MRALSPLGGLLLGCVPHLQTPAGAEPAGSGGSASGSDYVAPVNSWDVGDPPPATLAPEGFAEGEVFPDLRLIDQHGDEVSFWQWYGMVVAVDLSTMWCGPCKELAHEVQITWDDYREEGFIYVTMLSQDNAGAPPDVDDLNVWADQFEIEAPVLSDDGTYANAIVPDQAWPRILVIGRDMRVYEGQVTPAKDDAIRATIEAAL
jgi:thiol-disulfide isomerase/thioredoxin